MLTIGNIKFTIGNNERWCKDMRFNLQRLRYERLSRKITQEKIAQSIGVKRSTYHKKENGKIRLDVEEFAIVLSVLGIPEKEAGIFFTPDVPVREQNVDWLEVK
ncbi:helix-turn-helix domain-containing protein [Halobacillus salinus]|uniref:XRE family transcriptional regulator n=1 Tax=Halobacillus salinus TaxID=192814 RepID=A0A4Z0H468_9BACI|nr:helix-turn-helix transcriptional regulator [Halobacillus salinus]TGB04714.1 XRE family transcriptional regulator [Halobacillus salinus]